VSIDELSHLQGENEDPRALIEGTEQECLVQEGLERLAPRDRLFMKLHFDQGLPIGEVAQAMQISTENAYTVKHRAVQRLRSFILSRRE